MANSDSAAAKKYASIAEVAAAQAQIVLQEAIKAPEYAEQAQEYAEQAQSSADTSSQLLTQVQSYTSIAETAQQDASQSATEAAASAISAAEFGDNSYTFADTTSGLAGTSVNQYFRVPQGSSSIIAFKYYLNNSGSAVEVAEVPGKGSISNNIRQYASAILAQEDISNGNILDGSYFYVLNQGDDKVLDEYINEDSQPSPTGRSIASYESIENIIPLNKSTVFINLNQLEYDFGLKFDTAITDGSGNLLSYSYGQNTTSLLNLELPNLSASKIDIDGKNIDPDGILDSYNKQNIISLGATTRFISIDNMGEYLFALKFDTIVLDGQNNVISYTIGSEQYNLFDYKLQNVSVESLVVGDVTFDPDNLLDAEDKNNVESLGESTHYSALDNADEYEFGPQYDTVVLDSQGNVIRYTKDTQEFSLLTGNFPALFINGVELDAEGILPQEDKTNLTTLSETTNFSSASSEYEFNPKAFVLTDAQKNILFDVGDYLSRSANWDVAYEKSQEITPQKTNPLAPWSQVDSSGKYQISVLDTASGTQVQVTSGTSNETNPRPDDLDRIVWQSDRSDPPPGGLFYADSTDFKEHAYIARSKIVGWGHSFMGNGAFLNRMRVLTSLDTYNFGISGQTSDAIAARQGGAPAYYAPSGGSIPASGSVTLTPAVAGPCRSLAAPVALKCNLAGVDGTFTWDGTNATFTRLTDGSAVTVSTAVALFVYPITTANVSGSIASGTEFDLHNECINLFWIGRNNISETSVILNNAISMVNYVKNIGQKIVIMADFNSSTEPPGSAAYSQMTTINSAIADKFPEFYCSVGGVDIRQNFINHANPASANDMDDVAAGLTPRSLRYDNLHPSQTAATSLDPTYALDSGANVNANFVYQFIKSKGWL